MMTHHTLPQPEPEAAHHSARLADLIRAEIRAHGAIPFSRYMELCLYAPGLGYYSAGARKFGAEGDFVTSPELGAVFANAVADAVMPVLSQLGPDAVFFELGGGSGAFAEASLRRWADCDALPGSYALLEPSADLRERQQARLQQLPDALYRRVRWLDGPIQHDWHGVLFANEVIDALPTPRFVIRQGEVHEEHVTLDDDARLTRTSRPADALLSAAVRHLERALGRSFAEGYRSEVLPQLPYWIQAVAGGLRRGAMLFVDYGYPRSEFYLPERDQGTLVCHYRHRAHGDPFFLPGLQDVTAFVDFTALAEAGVGAGFDFSGYCSQASFLIGNGLAEQLTAMATLPEADHYRRALEVKRLTLPGEMGERFQAIGFERDVDFSPAFALGDLSHRL